MNLSLPPKIQKLIDRRVKSGRYHSAQDVVTAALVTLDQQESLAGMSAADLETIYPGIKEKLAQGLAAARAGDVSDGEAFFGELEREERTLATKRRMFGVHASAYVARGTTFDGGGAGDSRGK